MHARTRTQFTAAEYLALDDASEWKNELIDGRILAMAGGSRAHSLIAMNISAELRAALKGCGRPCEVYTSDRRVQLASSDSFVYPDASVACPPVEFDGHSLLNPRVIIEVLSPSTEDYDRGEKLARYLAIPSVTDVLLIAQDARRVEHHRRAGPGGSSKEVVTSGVIAIESLGVEVALDEIYYLVDLPG